MNSKEKMDKNQFEDSEWLNHNQIQNVELEMMKKIHEYCDKHSLRYCLVWGSLLGAVRHNGFIPWDNDIDIMMPRSDYEKLRELEKQEPIADNIKIFHYSNKNDYFYHIMRACNTDTVVYPEYLRRNVSNMGLWIDIFPLDTYYRPLYFLQRFFILINLRIWIANTYIPKTSNKIKLLAKKIITTFLTDKNGKYAKRINRLSKWFNKKKSKKVSILLDEGNGYNPQRFAFDRNNIENAILHKFEDTMLYIPQDSDSILKSYYGDYMTLPNLEDRYTHEINVKRISNNP